MFKGFAFVLGQILKPGLIRWSRWAANLSPSHNTVHWPRNNNGFGTDLIGKALSSFLFRFNRHAI